MKKLRSSHPTAPENPHTTSQGEADNARPGRPKVGDESMKKRTLNEQSALKNYL